MVGFKAHLEWHQNLAESENHCSSRFISIPAKGRRALSRSRVSAGVAHQLAQPQGDFLFHLVLRAVCQPDLPLSRAHFRRFGRHRAGLKHGLPQRFDRRRGQVGTHLQRAQTPQRLAQHRGWGAVHRFWPAISRLNTLKYEPCLPRSVATVVRVNPTPVRLGKSQDFWVMAPRQSKKTALT